MATEDEDLELLLSMQCNDDEGVVRETPPSSPVARSSLPSVRRDDNALSSKMAEIRSNFVTMSKRKAFSPSTTTSHSLSQDVPIATSSRLGYCSDEDFPKPKHTVSMAAFKEVVKDSVELVGNRLPSGTQKKVQNSSIFGVDEESFSGLRIKDRVISTGEASRRFGDLRFVRLPAIKMASACGKFSGAWATAGILVEKGFPRASTTGKNYAVWKLSSLEKSLVSVFVFGDAYSDHWKELPGTILAVLNAKVRPDEKTKEPCLSVFNRDQLMKLGTSMDFAICKGQRKDGTKCTVAINKRLQGQYCQYHLSTAQQQYKTSRPELNGGKMTIIGPGFKRGKLVKPLSSPVKDEMSAKPLKFITTSQMKDLLSGERMTSIKNSQGKRFLQNMVERNPNLGVGVKKELTQPGEKRKSFLESAISGKRIPLAEREMNAKCPRKVQADWDSKGKSRAEVIEIDLSDGD